MIVRMMVFKIEYVHVYTTACMSKKAQNINSAGKSEESVTVSLAACVGCENIESRSFGKPRRRVPPSFFFSPLSSFLGWRKNACCIMCATFKEAGLLLLLVPQH